MVLGDAPAACIKFGVEYRVRPPFGVSIVNSTLGQFLGDSFPSPPSHNLSNLKVFRYACDATGKHVEARLLKEAQA